MIVPARIFEQCLQKEQYEKYIRFLCKSFVDLSYNAKWCPGKGCAMICANKLGEPVEVECSCGTRFCYGCLEAPHPPINCDLLEKWIGKAEDQVKDVDAEMTAAWIN